MYSYDIAIFQENQRIVPFMIGLWAGRQEFWGILVMKILHCYSLKAILFDHFLANSDVFQILFVKVWESKETRFDRNMKFSTKVNFNHHWFHSINRPQAAFVLDEMHGNLALLVMILGYWPIHDKFRMNMVHYPYWRTRSCWVE